MTKEEAVDCCESLSEGDVFAMNGQRDWCLFFDKWDCLEQAGDKIDSTPTLPYGYDFNIKEN